MLLRCRKIGNLYKALKRCDRVANKTFSTDMCTDAVGGQCLDPDTEAAFKRELKEVFFYLFFPFIFSFSCGLHSLVLSRCAAIKHGQHF